MPAPTLSIETAYTTICGYLSKILITTPGYQPNNNIQEWKMVVEVYFNIMVIFIER